MKPGDRIGVSTDDEIYDATLHRFDEGGVLLDTGGGVLTFLSWHDIEGVWLR